MTGDEESLEHLEGGLFAVTSLMSGFATMNNVSILSSPLQNARSIHCSAEPALPLPEPSDLMSFC